MNKDESVAVKLEPFDNYVTRSILGIIISMIVIGILLIINSKSNTWFFSGIGITCLGVIAGIYGATEFPENPPTAGALFCWNVPIMSNGKQIVVGGKTFLADYFPFYISAVSIDMSNRNKEFPISVVSKDNVLLEGIVSVTARPEVDDIQDFIQAGAKTEEAFKQMSDIITTKSREYAKEHNQDKLITDGQLIGSDLFKDVEQGSFGICIFKVNVVLKMPDEIKKAMQGKVTEGYERENEKAEYNTNLSAAQELQRAYEKDPHRPKDKPVPSLRDCLEEIMEQRLIRDGKATGIKNKGGTTITIPKT